jgi:hypothetical protein
MKASFLHVNDHGADPERAHRIPSPTKGASGDRGNVNVLVELVLHTSAGRTIATRIADPAVGLHVPDLVDVEVTQALRRYARDGELDATAAAVALDDLRALDSQRHSHEPFTGSRLEASREPESV